MRSAGTAAPLCSMCLCAARTSPPALSRRRRRMARRHDRGRARRHTRRRARRLRVLRQARADDPESTDGGQRQQQPRAPTRHRRSLPRLVRLEIVRRFGRLREPVELMVPIRLTIGLRLDLKQLEERFLVDLEERTRAYHIYSVARVLDHPPPRPRRRQCGARPDAEGHRPSIKDGPSALSHDAIHDAGPNPHHRGPTGSTPDPFIPGARAPRVVSESSCVL